MLKCIKYEFKRVYSYYIIVLFLVALMQLILGDTYKNLVGMVAAVFLEIVAVVAFYIEMESEYSLMMYSVPYSTYGIIASKYIVHLFSTLFSGAIMYAIGVWHIGSGMARVVMLVDLLFFAGVIVSLSYFSITLSAVIISKQRDRNWLTMLIFMVLLFGVVRLNKMIPTYNFGDKKLIRVIMSQWPMYAFGIIGMVTIYVAVVELIKRKVDM